MKISEEVERQLDAETQIKSCNGFFEIAIEEDSRILELPEDPPPQMPMQVESQHVTGGSLGISSGRVIFNSSGQVPIIEERKTPERNKITDAYVPQRISNYLYRPFEPL